jgi:hypothetical protein
MLHDRTRPSEASAGGFLHRQIIIGASVALHVFSPAVDPVCRRNPDIDPHVVMTNTSLDPGLTPNPIEELDVLNRCFQAELKALDRVLDRARSLLDRLGWLAGSPRYLPDRGSHRSGRADFPHPALRSEDSRACYGP